MTTDSSSTNTNTTLQILSQPNNIHLTKLAVVSVLNRYNTETNEIVETNIELETVEKKITSDDFSRLPDEALISTRIPPRTPGSNQRYSSECILLASTIRLLGNDPTFMTQEPEQPDNRDGLGYRIDKSLLQAGGSGIRMLSTRLLKVGELLFSERPLVIMPSNTGVILNGIQNRSKLYGGLTEIDVHIIMERLLKVVVRRQSNRNSGIFKHLRNAKSGRSLSDIWDTNFTACRSLDQLYNNADNEKMPYFQAVSEQVSSINHSCAPNCSVVFDVASFSFQVCVTRPIGKGKEIFLAHANPLNQTITEDRQEKLFLDRGINCACSICTDADDQLILEIGERHLELQQDVMNAIEAGNVFTYDEVRKIYIDSKDLLDDMIKLRLDGLYEYKSVLDIPVLAAEHLDDVTEEERVKIEWNISRWKEYMAPYEKAWMNYFDSDD